MSQPPESQPTESLPDARSLAGAVDPEVLRGNGRHKGEGKKAIVFDLNAKNGPLKWNRDGDYPYRKKMGVLEYEQ